MKRPAKHRRGQFIVAAAMFIALIILSMSLLIYSAGSRYQTLEKEPVREIVQTITDDFKRMLTIALADYSEYPDDTAFNRAVSGWADKTIYCYSGMGLQLMISEVNVYKEDFENSSETEASATLKIDIASLGFYGYEYPLQIKLNVTLDEVKYATDKKNGKITSLNITVKAFKEKDLPVSDLKITTLNVIVYNNSGAPEDINVNIAKYMDVVYVSGSGIYIITLKQNQEINPTNPNFGAIRDLKVYLEFEDGRGLRGYVWKEGEVIKV